MSLSWEELERREGWKEKRSNKSGIDSIFVKDEIGQLFLLWETFVDFSIIF